jgi:hypothetical protein
MNGLKICGIRSKKIWPTGDSKFAIPFLVSCKPICHCGLEGLDTNLKGRRTAKGAGVPAIVEACKHLFIGPPT